MTALRHHRVLVAGVVAAGENVVLTGLLAD
jgi:hypothetical protein